MITTLFIKYSYCNNHFFEITEWSRDQFSDYNTKHKDDIFCAIIVCIALGSVWVCDKAKVLFRFVELQTENLFHDWTKNICFVLVKNIAHTECLDL